MTSSEVFIYSDGACRGNPGPASYGVVFYNAQGQVLGELSHFIGDGLTNNIAEYEGILAGLRYALSQGWLQVVLHSDSELAIRQLNGQYKMKNEKLRSYFQEIQSLTSKFASCRFVHVQRERNRMADNLANNALDKRKK